MDINTQNSSGMMNGMPPKPQTEKKVGPIAGALIIVLILIIAALYFFGQKLNTESIPQQSTSALQSPAAVPTDAMSANASSSNDVASLQADLNSQLKDVDYSF